MNITKSVSSSKIEYSLYGYLLFLLLVLLLSLHSASPLVTLKLPNLEPDGNDPVVNQVLVSQELKDVTPAVKKLAQDFDSMKPLLVK